MTANLRFPKSTLASTLRKLGLALAAGTLVFASASPAWAWDDFPGYVQNALGMQCAPTCLLCHTSPEGGRETVREATLDGTDPVRGFGVFVSNLIYHRPSLIGQKTQPAESEIVTALQALKTEPCVTGSTQPCDSDGDGAGKQDVLELSANQDPDDPAADAPICVGPRYGCGAHVAPAESAPRSSDFGALAAALVVAFVLVRRARR